MSYTATTAKLVEEIHTLKFKIEQQSIFNENNKRQAQIASEGLAKMGSLSFAKDAEFSSIISKGQGDLRRNQQKMEAFVGEMLAEYHGKVAALEHLVSSQEMENTRDDNELNELRLMLDTLRDL